MIFTNYDPRFVFTSPGQGFTTTSTDKIFENNCTFHVKQRTTEKVQFLFSGSFLLVLTKFSFWEKDWALHYTSMKF